jgi:Mg-chelatase subunit ChlI
VTDSPFTLLGDQPYQDAADPLRFDHIANDLAHVVLGSRTSTPLALGIEGGWGMGKSTLMRRLEAVLAEQRQVETVCSTSGPPPKGAPLRGLSSRSSTS